jgi:hypothetical protein
MCVIVLFEYLENNENQLAPSRPWVDGFTCVQAESSSRTRICITIVHSTHLSEHRYHVGMCVIALPEVRKHDQNHLATSRPWVYVCTCGHGQNYIMHT